jgi:hypothetical protein
LLHAPFFGRAAQTTGLEREVFWSEPLLEGVGGKAKLFSSELKSQYHE